MVSALKRLPLLGRRCLVPPNRIRGRQPTTLAAPPTRSGPARFSSRASGPPVHASGLFSIPELRAPADFLTLAAEAIDTCNGTRRDLRAQLSVPLSRHNRHQAQDYLFQLDHISRTVCNVIDAAELCRQVHTSEEWKESANRAFDTLSSYIGELNADTTLYQTILKVIQANGEGNIQPPLTEEEQRFCRLLRAEFERDGIHLPEEQRLEVQHLQSHIIQLETMFTQNLLHKSKPFQIDRSVLEEIFPAHLLEARGIGPQVQTLTIATDSDVANTLSKFAVNPTVRRQIHLESMTACPENLPVLDSLIELRNQVAHRLGFESYADRFLRDKMAGRPDRVHDFLTNVLRSNQSAYRREMEELAQAKRKMEGVAVGTIEPWDIAFYTSILKQRNGWDATAVSDYLTLDNCIRGIRTLVDRLFGIQMIEREVSAGDAWDVDPNSPTTTSLRRLEFVDPQGESLGTIYLDLKKRRGKYGHAAHFTVRCGCRLERPSAQGGDGTDAFQRPVIALVCNLSNFSNDGNSRLTHTEVETIYHELGHMLHSMLSRTQFQHLSGTRAPMDFVETPSHWLENFVWDPEFLRVLARHHDTGEVIPDELITGLRKSRYQYHAIERQNQAILALFDQAIHGASVQLKDLSNSPAIRTTTEIFAHLHRTNGAPYAEGTHWHSQFGHLVTYGGGYYGYLYSQVFAQDIWNSCFEGNSMSREAGDRIWKKMLIHGGARDPHLMLSDILGRPSKFES